MRSIEHKSFKGTAIGFISFLMNMAYSLMLVPVFLTFWGEEKYGYFLAIYAFIQVMRTLDTGHQIFIGNEFNKYYYLDSIKAYKILSSSIFIAFVLGLIELLIFLIMWNTGLLDTLIGIDFQSNTFYILGMTSMLVMWWLVGSVGGILARIILAKGYYSESVMFAILIKFIETAILFLAVYYNSSISATFLYISVATLLYSIGVFYWTAKRMPEYFPWWKNFNLKTGFTNFGKSMILTINGFLDQMNTNGILFLIGKFLSPVTIPVFTTIRTVTNTMTILTNLTVLPLVPEMIRFQNADQKEKIWKIIEVNWLVSGALISFSFLILVPIVEFLFDIWTKGQIEFNSILFYLLALSVVALNFGKSMTSYLAGINDLKGISILAYLRFVIVFGVSLLYINSLGLNAIGVGLLLSEIVCSVIIPAFLVRKHLTGHNFNMHKLIFALLPMIVLGGAFVLCFYYTNRTFLFCMLSALIISIVYIFQWKLLEDSIKHRIVTFLSKSIRVGK